MRPGFIQLALLYKYIAWKSVVEKKKRNQQYLL